MSEKTIKTMRERDMRKASSDQKLVKILVQVLLYTFLIVMALIIIFPFYWMLISSVKSLLSSRYSSLRAEDFLKHLLYRYL